MCAIQLVSTRFAGSNRAGEKSAVTNLTSCVDNLCQVILSLVSDCLGECILDRGVVAVDEAIVDELDSERGLACDDDTTVN